MKTSKIEWTEATWNPSVGCTKISPGCAHCYAENMAKRLQAIGSEDYRDGFTFKTLPHRLNIPLKTTKPTKFFVNSMSDLFHEEMPLKFLDEIFRVIELTPQHTYQILTKREKNMYEYLKDKKLPHNIWLGVTVENTAAKERIDFLRKINVEIRFLSVEPLLEDLGEIDLTDIDWVIVGGESGPRARPMKSLWAENVQRECKKQEVAFFFKQWGTWGADGKRRNKKINGRVLKGRIWEEYPSKVLVAQ